MLIKIYNADVHFCLKNWDKILIHKIVERNVITAYKIKKNV